jgi:hypothetical protein
LSKVTPRHSLKDVVLMPSSPGEPGVTNEGACGRIDRLPGLTKNGFT